MAGNKGYLYTNGVIASISKKLINKDTFHKIIDATSLDNAISIFNNTALVNSKKNNTVFEINQLLDNELKNINNFLKRECPEDDFINYINCQYDYYNLENIYKSSLLKLNVNDNCFIEGNYTISKLNNCVISNSYDDLNNKFIKKLFIEINKIKDKLKNWALIDFYFKSYCYKNLYEIVKKNKVLLKILKYKIDFQNICLSSRVSNFDDFKKNFIDNGSIDLKVFEKFINENKYSISNLDKVINNWIEILKLSNNDEKLRLFEKESNLIELKVLSSYGEDIESIIPFLKYYYKKLLEIKNLRMIFSLKSNNLNPFIKDRFLEVS